MVPTLATVLGVKGRRPVVGTRDCKDLLYVCASINCITGQLHTRTLENRQADNRRARKCKGISKARRMQMMFARHLEDVVAAYPGKRIVMVVDNAPWHRGTAVNEVLARHPLLQLYRLPSYSPQLNVIERFWKLLRRRATHNRLFDELADLKTSVRASIHYFQRLTSRVIGLIQNCYRKNRTVSSGV
jgi:transposase